MTSDARINWAAIDGAGKLAGMIFEGMKAAVRADRSKTVQEKMGILQKLTQDQAAAVQQARKSALERERARTKKPQKGKAGKAPRPPGNGPQSPGDRPRL